MDGVVATGQSVSLQERAKLLFRRAAEDLHVAHTAIATALHRNRTKVDQWASTLPEHESCAPPQWALLEPAAIPDAMFERLVSDWRDERASRRTSRGLTPRAEGVATVLQQRLGLAVAQIAEAMEDGRISSLERGPVLKRVADVEEECRRLRRAFGEAVDAESGEHARTGNVAPIRKPVTP